MADSPMLFRRPIQKQSSWPSVIKAWGGALKSAGRFAEAQVAWHQALDILTRLTVLHPEGTELQRRWCDCANDLAWLLLSHPDSRLT